MAGTLFIVGGAMGENAERIFRELIRSAGGPAARFAFAVSASGSDPDDTFRSYREDVHALGVPRENCVLIPLYSEGVTDERGYNAVNGDAEGLTALLEGVTGVWFTGGDQYYTSKCFLRSDGADTAALSALRKIYADGGVIGGSSAGAAIMSRAMIGAGSNRGVLRYGVKYDYDGYCESADPDGEVACEPLMMTSAGLGFFTEGIVDQHFNARPRLIRSIEACFANRLGVRRAYGVGESTALIYREGRMEVLGSEGVYIMDCENAVRTAAGAYENVDISLLYEGDIVDGGVIRLAGERTEGERFFPHDYIIGGVPESGVFDDCLNKLLCAEPGCLFRDGEGRGYVISAVPYRAGDRDYLLRLRYTVSERSDVRTRRDGHTSAAHVRLDTAVTEF